MNAQGSAKWARSGAALVAAAIVLAGCAEGGRTEYGEVDSPQASPGTVRDASTATQIGVDTGHATGGRTGAPAVAGDTLGARGQPVGVPDTLRRTDTGRVPPPR